MVEIHLTRLEFFSESMFQCKMQFGFYWDHLEPSMIISFRDMSQNRLILPQELKLFLHFCLNIVTARGLEFFQKAYSSVEWHLEFIGTIPSLLWLLVMEIWAKNTDFLKIIDFFLYFCLSIAQPSGLDFFFRMHTHM